MCKINSKTIVIFESVILIILIALITMNHFLCNDCTFAFYCILYGISLVQGLFIGAGVNENYSKEVKLNNKFILFYFINFMLIMFFNYFIYYDKYYYNYMLIIIVNFLATIILIQYLYENKSVVKGNDTDINHDDEGIKFSSLAAKSDEKEYKRYISTFDSLINDKDNFNIAIDAIYGSGKSSLIKTYKEMHEDDYKFVNVSFAKFSEDNNSQDDDEVMSRIYDEILISHREKPNYFLGFLISSFAYCLLIVLNEVLKLFNSSIVLCNLISILFIVGTLLIVIIMSSIRKGKIGLGDYSFEIDKGTSSIDVKRIKLLRMLKAYKKNIIVFLEDLDRFENINIFSHFRELNFLLNQKLTNKIVFVYALDTSLFKNSEERVKFFDAILPVIPKFTKNNIYIDLYHELGEGNPDNLTPNMESYIDSRLLLLVSEYLDNKRNIYNLENDYRLTFEIFIDANKEYYLKQRNKIFLIIAIKNIFPRQYKDLIKSNNFMDYIFNFIYQNHTAFTIKKELYTIEQCYQSIVLNTQLNNEKSMDLMNMSYEQLVSIIDSSIKYDESEKYGVNYTFTVVNSKSIRSKLVGFLAKTISLGYLNMDYIDYIIPIDFSRSGSESGADFSEDLKNRTKIMYNSLELPFNFEFNNPYQIIATLHLKFFGYQSILIYQIIRELYTRLDFNDKRRVFENQFIDSDNNICLNERLMSLIKKFINNCESNADYDFLGTLVTKNSFFRYFEKDANNLPLLAKYISEINAGKPDFISNAIGMLNESIKILIKHNIELFFENLDSKLWDSAICTFDYIKFNKNLDLNLRLLVLNKYDNSKESLDELLDSIPGGKYKISRVLDKYEEIENKDYYAPSRFNSLLSNLKLRDNNCYLEKEDLFYRFDELNMSVASHEEAVKAIELENYDLKLIKNNTAFKYLLKEKKIPFTIENLNYIHNKSTYSYDLKSDYYHIYYKEILKLDNYDTYINNSSIAYEIIVNKELEPLEVKKLIDKGFVDCSFSTKTTKEKNLMNYALVYEPRFDKHISINNLFNCKDEDILRKYVCLEDDLKNYYLEKYKTIYGKNVNESRKLFIEIVYPDLTVENNQIKEE